MIYPEILPYLLLTILAKKATRNWINRQTAQTGKECHESLCQCLDCYDPFLHYQNWVMIS